jgi:acyl dehydratase
MSIYSGAQSFWRSIHTDRDVAIDSGLKGTVAQGLMVATYLSEWATDLFGTAWFASGWMSLSFLAPLFAEDTVSLFAVVTEVAPQGDGTRVEVEAWAQNQDGQKAVVGWFACTVPR